MNTIISMTKKESFIFKTIVNLHLDKWKESEEKESFVTFDGQKVLFRVYGIYVKWIEPANILGFVLISIFVLAATVFKIKGLLCMKIYERCGEFLPGIHLEFLHLVTNDEN